MASIAVEHDQDEISKENSRKIRLQSGTVIRIFVEDNSLVIEPLQEPAETLAHIESLTTVLKTEEITWKAVAERMATAWAARAGTTMEEILRYFGAPGY